MTQYLVVGDGVALPSKLSDKKPDLNLLITGRNKNLRLQVDVFRTHLWRDPTQRLDDLLHLAAFVYGADTRISRGSNKDVFASKWPRSFRMVLPVWDVAFWKSQEVREMLVETLQFLTGDEFAFDFVQRQKIKRGQVHISRQSARYGEGVGPFEVGEGLALVAATICYFS